MSLIRAQRKQVPLKIGLSGPSGAGKTYSALLMASGMTEWEKIAVIDTENKSASLYSHLGPYFVCELSAPYSPEKYIEAIRECEKAGIKVIIIDSITHEWDGQGGCLDIQNALGGRYQDWAKVTPRHQAFVEAIQFSPCHVITCVRRKQDYDMSKDANGKLTVTKVGMKEVTREGFEYELTLSLEISINHFAKGSKDRTGLFMDKPEFIITPDTGRALIAWSESGAGPQAKRESPAATDSQSPILDAVSLPAAHTKESVLALLKEKSKTPDGLKAVKAAIENVASVKTFNEVPENKYPALVEELSALKKEREL